MGHESRRTTKSEEILDKMNIKIEEIESMPNNTDTEEKKTEET